MNKPDINAISNRVGVLELFMAMRSASLVTQNVVTQNMSPKNVMGPVNSLLMALAKYVLYSFPLVGAKCSWFSGYI